MERAGIKGCEMSRIPHFLDSRLIDGGEVVSLTRQKYFLLLPLEAEAPGPYCD
jgi:hypothetical protein